jgi:hypothetical protein
MFEAAVGISRKWDALEAGGEAARNALGRLSGKPNVVMLFATIHYEKGRGFQKLLDGACSALPKGVPLVGGTVAGFYDASGVYSRGVSALAIRTDEMGIAVGAGHNTKRRPESAARDIARQVRAGLRGSGRANSLLINFNSAGTIPVFPLFPRTNVMKSRLKAELTTVMLDAVLMLTQKGVSRDEDILDTLTGELPEFRMISGSFVDDIKILSNYQFVGRKVFGSTDVAVAFNTDYEVCVNTTHGLAESGVEMEATGFRHHKRVVSGIEGEPAVKKFLEKLGWDPDMLDDKVYRRIWYYPIQYVDSHGCTCIAVIGVFLGDYFLTTFSFGKPRFKVLKTSGRSLIGAVKENLESYRGKKPVFGFCTSCGIRLLTLGAYIYREQEMMKEFFGDVPFLAVFVGGEGTFDPSRGLIYGNDTFNTAILCRK